MNDDCIGMHVLPPPSVADAECHVIIGTQALLVDASLQMSSK